MLPFPVFPALVYHRHQVSIFPAKAGPRGMLIAISWEFSRSPQQVPWTSEGGGQATRVPWREQEDQVILNLEPSRAFPLPIKWLYILPVISPSFQENFLVTENITPKSKGKRKDMARLIHHEKNSHSAFVDQLIVHDKQKDITLCVLNINNLRQEESTVSPLWSFLCQWNVFLYRRKR